MSGLKEDEEEELIYDMSINVFSFHFCLLPFQELPRAVMKEDYVSVSPQMM